MAAAGFPWQAESHVREPTYLDEKISEKQIEGNPPEEKPVEPAKHVANNTSAAPAQSGKRCSHSQSGKRRSDSMKRYTPTSKADTRQLNSLKREGPTQIPVRTLPAWIRDVEEDDLEEIVPGSLDSPDVAFLAHHNHSPSSPQRLLTPGSVRHHRAYPTSSGFTRPDRTSRWISFGRASAYPRENFHGENVDKEWLDKNFTDYSQPWLANHDDDDDEEGFSRYRAFRRRRQAWYKRAQFTILRNPFIPLAFRLTVIVFAVTAIALGVTIFHQTGRISRCVGTNPADRDRKCSDLVGNTPVDYYRDPSALMAIIVDAIAVVYSCYITYDEYFSKPLGLRKARAKIRLVLLDLFFIVFQSANLSLSFESLTVEEGACAVGGSESTFVRFDDVCTRQQALSAVLLVSLVAWLMTFSVSVLRYVHPLNLSTATNFEPGLSSAWRRGRLVTTNIVEKQESRGDRHLGDQTCSEGPSSP
jgi:hypothetical protein